MTSSRVLTLSLAVLLCASCGEKNESGDKPKPGMPMMPGTTPPPAEKARPAEKPVPPSARTLESRVSDSLLKTFNEDKMTLPSYHAEVVTDGPHWNKKDKQVEQKKATMSADVAGDDIHYVRTQTKDGAEDRFEGWSIDGGSSKADKGGKEYQLGKDGKLTEGFAVLLPWVMMPLDLTFALSYGATGITPAGEEAVDGRAAEKYELDSARAEPGVIEALSQMFALTAAKGTVWIDKETGALLKMVMDYEQNLIDPPGSKTVVGKGKGHIDVMITKVGAVTVQAPK